MFIKAASAVGGIASCVSFIWHCSLSKADQRRYDAQAAKFAMEIFQKAMSRLSAVDAMKIHNLTRRVFVN